MAMSPALFATDYRSEPYWWQGAPCPSCPQVALPDRCDVAIVGSGYTGLAAAIELARGGRQVLLLDAEDAGWGCSTRNGGQVSSSIKPSFSSLKARHGEAVALSVRREGLNALEWIDEFIKRERFDCDYSRVGRFHAAHNAAAYNRLAREAAHQPKGLEVEVQVVPRAEQHREIGSDLYHGGLVYPAHAALHPGKFHRGLLSRAQQAGATLITRCPVTAIARDRTGFRLNAPHGVVRAREVIVATNGYTTGLTPWLRRRIIPIGSYIIATEPLSEGLARRLIPNNRVVTDSRKVVFYYRLSEDRERMLFGGRVAAKEIDPLISAPRLHRRMSQVFPELAATKISRSWGGFIAYTFDALPHLGQHVDGIHYCMGYCGSGVSLAPYFGTRLAQQLLGKPEGRTALDGLTFQTRPLYSGNPWFIPAAIAYYQLRDRLEIA
jgi:glycine/D-amino acid oxidase-like deaminating enzyme